MGTAFTSYASILVWWMAMVGGNQEARHDASGHSDVTSCNFLCAKHFMYYIPAYITSYNIDYNIFYSNLLFVGKMRLM